MAQVFVFGPDDSARIRFAVSPAWETFAAVRVVADPSRRDYHLPWLDEVRGRIDGSAMALLGAFSPRAGWTPDFLTPLPAGPAVTMEDQLRLIRATPLEVVGSELRRSLAARGDATTPRWVVELAGDHLRARRELADAMESIWQTLIALHWANLAELLAADIAHRSRRIAAYGLEAALSEMHPRLEWRDRRLTVSGPLREHRRLGGAGMVLVPSVFVWPAVTALSEVSPQPAVVYPARGIAELWKPAPRPEGDALGRLLGPTRAALLQSLAEPATTATLARRHQLAPSTVSEHLGVLRDARLAVGRRQGSRVVYRQTALGARLSAAPR